MRALVDDGTLGEVRRFESRFERYAPDAGPGASGGGTLLDFGAHLVDQALTLLGSVDRVHAEFRTRDSGLDDDVFVALRHTNGAVSHLWGAGASTPQDHGSASPARPPPLSSRRPTPRRTCWSPVPAPRRSTPGVSSRPPSSTGSTPGPSRHRSLLVRGAWDTYYPTFARAVRGVGAPPVERPTRSRPPTCSRPPVSAPGATSRFVWVFPVSVHVTNLMAKLDVPNRAKRQPSPADSRRSSDASGLGRSPAPTEVCTPLLMPKRRTSATRRPRHRGDTGPRLDG